MVLITFTRKSQTGLSDKVSEATEIKKAAQGISLAGRSKGDWTMISVHEGDQLWRLDPKHFSSQTKLIRVQAWVRCFIDNCRRPNREREELKAEEIEDAVVQVIEGAQRELPKKTKLLGLQPWLDEEGQMRCDGRLKHAEFLPRDARFLIILPHKNCVTKLIVKHHEKDNHAGGTNQLLAAYQHASGSFLVAKKFGNGTRSVTNPKEEKLKLQNKLWPLSHRSDLDFP